MTGTKRIKSNKNKLNLNTDVIAGPKKTDDSDDKIKVRISRIKSGELVKEGDEIRNKQIEDLEKSVQKGLEEAGLGEATS